MTLWRALMYCTLVTHVLHYADFEMREKSRTVNQGVGIKFTGGQEICEANFEA